MLFNCNELEKSMYNYPNISDPIKTFVDDLNDDLQMIKLYKFTNAETFKLYMYFYAYNV